MVQLAKLRFFLQIAKLLIKKVKKYTLFRLLAWEIADGGHDFYSGYSNYSVYSTYSAYSC